MPSRLTWADFRRRYEEEKLASLSRQTQEVAAAAFGHLERLLNPDRLVKLTASTLSLFQRKLRDEGLKEPTIAKILRQVKTALRWGAAMSLVAVVPRIEMPKKGKGSKVMKGRPLCTEEFERLLACVERGLFEKPPKKSKAQEGEDGPATEEGSPGAYAGAARGPRPNRGTVAATSHRALAVRLAAGGSPPVVVGLGSRLLRGHHRQVSRLPNPERFSEERTR